MVDAYDKLPRNHGVKIAVIRLTEDGKQGFDIDIPESDYEAEGFRFFDDAMASQHERITTAIRRSFKLPVGRTLLSVLHQERQTAGYFDTSSVIRFELVDVLPAGIALAERFGVKAWQRLPASHIEKYGTSLDVESALINGIPTVTNVRGEGG